MATAPPTSPRYVDPDFQKGMIVLRYLHHLRPEANLHRLSAVGYLATRDHLRRCGRLVWQDNYLPLSIGPCPSVFAFYLRALSQSTDRHIWTVPEYEDFILDPPALTVLPAPSLDDNDSLSISDRRHLDETLRTTDGLADSDLLALTRDDAWNAGRADNLIGLDHLLLTLPEDERAGLADYLFDHTPTWTL